MEQTDAKRDGDIGRVPSEGAGRNLSYLIDHPCLRGGRLAKGLKASVPSDLGVPN